MNNLLFELLVEELPARFINQAVRDLKEIAKKVLEENRLKFVDLKTAGTPRRLVLFVEGLSERQDDLQEEVLGPSTKVAFDERGNPTKAALGFLAKFGASPSDLWIKETSKGPYVALNIKKSGEETIKILPNLLIRIISEIPFPKRMIWGKTRFPFARPIRSVLALFGERTLPLELAGLKSVNYTYGHRYLAKEPIFFNSADWLSYVEVLRNSWVIVDPEERLTYSEKEIYRIAQGIGIPEIEADLLTENANLVEFPFPTLGTFDPKFLLMPEELTKTALQEHQRYFLLRDREGKLLNHFIAINNNKVKDESILKNGHERVAKARLEDALFYYQRDLKQSLDNWVKALKGIVYHIRCGTLYEKMERVRRLAHVLGEALGLEEYLGQIDAACYYAKADFASEVVKEFPALQGIMGKYYFLNQFKDEIVAKAIEEQYLPLPGQDYLPETPCGVILSLADKIDHLCALFGVNEKPTGESDPYGLRRASYGIIKILMGKALNLEVEPFIRIASDGLQIQGYLQNLKAPEEVIEYLVRRLEGEFQALGYSKALVAFILSRPLNPYDQLLRIKTLEAYTKMPEFEDLTTSFKRVYLILKNQCQTSLPEVSPSLFLHESERRLYSLVERIKDHYFKLLAEGKYQEALLQLAKFKPFIAEFFAEVFVMVEDDKIRQNRLSLLKEIYQLYKAYGNFEALI